MLTVSDAARLACTLVATVPLVAASSGRAGVLRGSGLAFPEALPAQGQGLEVVGTLDPTASDPPFEPASGEVTWTLYGASVHAVEEPFPGIRDRHLTFGVLEIRADPSSDAFYFANPPNAFVPRTFHDGEIVLLGTVTALTIRESSGIVTASGEVRFEAGSSLPDVTAEWTLNAAVSTEGDVPAGYGSQWNLELAPSRPVHINSETWTTIKGLYR